MALILRTSNNKWELKGLDEKDWKYYAIESDTIKYLFGEKKEIKMSTSIIA